MDRIARVVAKVRKVQLPRFQKVDGYDQVFQKNQSVETFKNLTAGLTAGAGLATVGCSSDESKLKWDEFF